jgi:hypothetical protein
MATMKTKTTKPHTSAEIVLSDAEGPLTLVRDLLQLQYEQPDDRLPLALNEKATEELDQVLAEISTAV